MTPTSTVLTKSFPEDKLPTAKTAVEVAGYGPPMLAAALPRPGFIPGSGCGVSLFRQSCRASPFRSVAREA